MKREAGGLGNFFFARKGRKVLTPSFLRPKP